MLRTRFLLCTTLLILVACGVSDEGDDGGGLPADEISVVISADKNVTYMETATFTCTYEVVSEPPLGTGVYGAEGYFFLPSTHFEILSGDSSWVDSVRVNEPRVHTVTVRPLVRGDWLIDALVKSQYAPEVRPIKGRDSIEIHVQ